MLVPQHEVFTPQQLLQRIRRYITPLWTVIEWGIFALLFFIYIVVLSPKLPTKSWVTFYVVPTGSMEPVVHAGSLAMTRPIIPSQLRVGHVIAFESPRAARQTILHRIVEITQEQGVLLYRTQGDNNSARDEWIVDQSMVHGVLVASVPYLGYPILFIHEPLGYAVVVGIPLLCMMAMQFFMIRAGIIEEIQKRRQARRDTRMITRVVVALLITVAAFSPFAAKVHALYVDAATIGGMTLTVQPLASASPTPTSFASPTPTPTVVPSPTPTPSPTPVPTVSPLPKLVINEVGQLSSNPQEWIELYNTSDTAITLSDWSVRDGNSGDTIPTSTIPAHHFAVIVTHSASTTLRNNITGLGAIVLEIADNDIGSGLNTTGDRVILQNGNGETVDQVSWGNDTSILNLPNIPSGKSLARNPLGHDTDTAADWQLLDTPNPGTNPHSHIIVQLSIVDHAVQLAFLQASGFTSVEYRVRYQRYLEDQAVWEDVHGTMTKQLDQQSLEIPPVFLGSCSSNNVCTPHEILHDVMVDVLYKNGQDIIGMSTYTVLP